MATTGIYALSTSDVNKLSDLPATFNSRIYMEALKAVSDETVYKIYNPHGKLSYVGFQYGTNAPIEWHQFIINTDLNETVRNLAIDGRLGLDFNSTTKILSLYLGSNRIGTINVN